MEVYICIFVYIRKRRVELNSKRNVKALDAYCRIIFQIENWHSSRNGWLSASPQPCQHWVSAFTFFSYLYHEKEIHLFLIFISLIISEVEHFFHMFISHLYFLSHELTSLLLKGRTSLQGLARGKTLPDHYRGALGPGIAGEKIKSLRGLPGDWLSRRLLSKPGAQLSTQSACSQYLFSTFLFVKKYFGFLKEDLYIPLKPVLVILSQPACLFSLGFFSESLIGSQCIAVDLAWVFYDPCHPARSCDCSVTFLDLSLLLVFSS